MNRTIEYLDHIRNTYLPYHGYICASICIAGVIFNLIHVRILSLKVLNSPVNRIFRLIAISDACLMGLYLVYSIRYYVWQDPDNMCLVQSFSWAAFALIYAHVSQFLYGMSIWLAVGVAGLRCFIMYSITQRSIAHQHRMATKVMIVILVFTLLCCTPMLLSFSVRRMPEINQRSCGKYEPEFFMVDASELNAKFNNLFLNMSYWTIGLCLKLVPCLCLLVCVPMLMRTLDKARCHRRRLMSRHSEQPIMLIPHGQTGSSNFMLSRKKMTSFIPNLKERKTTLLLILILVIFLITQTPQGVISVASGCFADSFFSILYTALGEISDLLSLLNSLCSFFCYICMNKEYRTQFVGFVCKGHVRDRTNMAISRTNV